MAINAYLVFHLNLAFSSIQTRLRSDVIARCYSPLLDLLEKRNLPIGIELTGWTLQQIADLCPAWVERFRHLLHEGRCELIGSGHSQLIGPLVPYEINQWNQALGLQDYQNLLGIRPQLALVNEMAFASGLVQVYQEAGYQGLIMDRDNVRLSLDLMHQAYERIPTHARCAQGYELPMLWSDSILFQKLQRWVHGDIPWQDYLDYFHKRAAGASRPLAVYCNDAEIFDFRPGRFLEESVLAQESEWRRMERLLARLEDEEGVHWLSPSQALAYSVEHNTYQPSTLTSVVQPIPVKKQAKYNIARWAISGRNDLWINSTCHRLLQHYGPNPDQGVKQVLCELWASDLRTHITPERWQEAQARVQQQPENIAPSKPSQWPSLPAHPMVQESADGLFVSVTTPDMRLLLNRRRGLVLHSLAFRSHGFVPVVGTISHGYFDAINYGADFYSGGLVIELPGEHRRLTDLVPVSWTVHQQGPELALVARIDTPLGPIVKTLCFAETGEGLQLHYDFPGWTRPKGIVRVGSTTLLPEFFQGPLTIQCRNGGGHDEQFVLDRECDHTRSSSNLVSCTTGFGATSGQICIGDAHHGVRLSWNPAQGAAFPMLIHHPVPPSHLTRIVFSLAELDDTARPEGPLLGFSYRIEPVIR